MNIKKRFSDSRLCLGSDDNLVLLHLKRNPVFAGKGFEELPYRTPFAALSLLETPTDTTNTFEQFLVVEQLLISFSALDHDLCLAVDGQHRRIARLLELADVVARVSLEFAQRVDVR